MTGWKSLGRCWLGLFIGFGGIWGARAASVTLIAPNGGERLVVGQPFWIEWTGSEDLGDVRIEYTMSGGGDWFEVFDGVPNSGSVEWTVPPVISSHVRMRILEVNGSAEDASDGEFRIVALDRVVLPLEDGLAEAMDVVSRCDHWVVNTSQEPAGVAVIARDGQGNLLSREAFDVPSRGKRWIDSDSLSGLGMDVLELELDRRLLVFVELESGAAHMAAYLKTPLSSNLFVPHIAEDVGAWNTLAFVSNVERRNLVVASRQGTAEVMGDADGFLDLEPFYVPQGGSAAAWVALSQVDPPPMPAEGGLTGFEMFVKQGGDGAATELTPGSFATLYIPHITTDDAVFWTGFALLNDSDSAMTVDCSFYSDSGQNRGTFRLDLPAQTKIKGTLVALFPFLWGRQASWGIIRPTGRLSAVELYGTHGLGICGFGLVGEPMTQAILPMLRVGSGSWNGIAVANPNDRDTHIEVRLMDGNGGVKMSKRESVQARSRFKAVIETYFQGASIEADDSLMVVSDREILAMQTAGTHDQTHLMALSAVPVWEWLEWKHKE